MQTFISKYGLAAHLALLAVTPLFLSPFCKPATIAVSLLWMSASAILWLLMEPSRRSGERLHEARLRVRESLLTDPLLWLFALIVVYTGICAFNGGIARTYDFEAGKWILEPAGWPILPGHAGEAGLMPFATTVALLVLLQGCRQALGKSARIALTTMIALFTGVAAIVFVIASRMDHQGVILLSGATRSAADATWSWAPALFSEPSVVSPFYISSVGNAFGLGLLASVVSAAGLFECKWNRLLLLFSFAIGSCALGLFYFATPMVLVFYLALAMVTVLLCTLYLVLALRTAQAMRFVMTILISGVVPFLFIVCVAPEAMTAAHASVFTGSYSFGDLLMPSDFWTVRENLSRFAASFWKDASWQGLGVGSFELRYWLVGEPEWLAATGGASSKLVTTGPLNGWWMLLAERGIAGLLTFLVPVAFMLFTFVHRLIGSIGRHAFLPLCGLGLMALGATVFTAFFDCSFLRPDTILPAGCFLALAASSFPVPRKRTADDDEIV